MRPVAAAIVVLAVAAVLLLALGDSGASTGIAYSLFGIAIVLAISAAFYVIGRSEERARAREDRAARDVNGGT